MKPVIIPGTIEKVNVVAPCTTDLKSTSMHEKIKRPKRLDGSTFYIKPPWAEHAMYFTINNIVLNEGTDHECVRPFEIFLNSKNMEHFAWVVALTRMVSAVFRKGGDIEFVVEELGSIFDPRGGYMQGSRRMPSLIAEMAFAIEDHLERTCGIQRDGKLSFGETKEFPPGCIKCPKCHVIAMVVEQNCQRCLNCSYDRCG